VSAFNAARIESAQVLHDWLATVARIIDDRPPTTRRRMAADY
jgi:hypothetical protein